MSRATTLTIAALLTMLAQAPASADGVVTCSGGWGMGGCTWREGVPQVNIRSVPEPKSEQDKAESAHRERQWVARCRPRLTVDQYGVQRYVYAASACDFGKYQ